MSANVQAQPAFSGSYDPADVAFLLKPVVLEPTPVAEKERLIQTGRRHYSEMLSPEAAPDAAYLALYDQALLRNGCRLARDIAALAAQLDKERQGFEIVLVSLARAGTPIGVLLARALRRRQRTVFHYSISIIRDRGVDLAALGWIAARHGGRDVVFVDGWTGKGVIAGELRRAMEERPFGMAPWLVVVADPAGAADLAATGEDYLIPSGMLNGVVSGLVSRSVLNAELIGPGDFHGCVRLDALGPHDLSRTFVDTVDRLITTEEPPPAEWSRAERSRRAARCGRLLDHIQAETGVQDVNRVKPGLAEAARALLRRSAGALHLRDIGDPDVAPLVHLAERRGTPLRRLPGWSPFQAVSIIAGVGDG